MMLQFIGWLSLCVIMLHLSMFCGLVMLNNAGHWNIGGVQNSITTRLGAWLFFIAVCGGWYEVCSIAPFTITFGVH